MMASVPGYLPDEPAPFSAEEIASWMKRHNIQCRRFHASISRSSCIKFQERNPDACHSCYRYKGEDRYHAGCPECGRVVVRFARGLCVTCWRELHASGELDQKYSRKKSRYNVDIQVSVARSNSLGKG